MLEREVPSSGPAHLYLVKVKISRMLNASAKMMCLKASWNMFKLLCQQTTAAGMKAMDHRVKNTNQSLPIH